MAGATHTIEANSPLSAGYGSFWVWRNWSDSGTVAHSVSPSADTTFTAYYEKLHTLSMLATPASGGTVYPQVSFYNNNNLYRPGDVVPIEAVASAGYVFSGWAGTGDGSYTGSSIFASVTMNAAISQTALFLRLTKPDFNANGHSEILWQNNVTGERAIWWMNGSSSTGAQFLPPVSPEWQIAATGDFNGDNQDDIVWQNNTTGQRAIWLMNGAQVAGERWLPAVAVQWQIAAAADFNSDNKPDLVWQNTVTGQRAIWWMYGTAKIGEYFLPTVPTNWEIVAAASFKTGDFRPDLLWQDKVTGQRVIWMMSGTYKYGEAFVAQIDPTWKIAGTGD
jgi:hypothetical protein